jgi:hypothetical protein
MSFTLCVVGALLLSFSTSGQQRDDAQVVEYAKGIDVARLDANLPNQRLEDWITATLTPDKSIVWRKSDCGLKPDQREPREAAPLCADFIVALDDTGVWGKIVVGTHQKGIQGEPHVHGVSLLTERGKVSRTTDRLSAIPGLLLELR